MTTDRLKNYPTATEDIVKIFGLEADSDLTDTTQYSSVVAGMPSNLPVLEGQLVTESESQIAEPVPDAKVVTHKPQSETEEYLSQTQQEAALELEKLTQTNNTKPVVKYAKRIAPYVAVFAVGLFVYYFYFTDFSFQSLLANAPKIESSTEKSTALDELIVENKSEYEAWMKRFYFDITDTSVFDPYADNSGNGLTNFQKYLLNLNPKEYDTLNLGMADGQAVVLGTDPATGEKFSKTRQALVERYFDLEAISNKVAAGAFSDNTVKVTINDIRGEAPKRSVLGVSTAQASGNSVAVNTDQSALLEIPKLKISVPLIWTRDTKNFDKDLKNGVVHYPGTALPGEIGTSYISGHSSNYAWVKSDYNKIFATLNDLHDNETFSITVTSPDGQKSKFNYIVRRRGEYLPNDQAQFANSNQSLVALSTCWPPGTTAKRLVVFGELTGIDKLN
jgi:sortase A